MLTNEDNKDLFKVLIGNVAPITPPNHNWKVAGNSNYSTADYEHNGIVPKLCSEGEYKLVEGIPEYETSLLLRCIEKKLFSSKVAVNQAYNLYNLLVSHEYESDLLSKRGDGVICDIEKYDCIIADYADFFLCINTGCEPETFFKLSIHTNIFDHDSGEIVSITFRGHIIEIIKKYLGVMFVHGRYQLPITGIYFDDKNWH